MQNIILLLQLVVFLLSNPSTANTPAVKDMADRAIILASQSLQSQNTSPVQAPSPAPVTNPVVAPYIPPAVITPSPSLPQGGVQQSQPVPINPVPTVVPPLPATTTPVIVATPVPSTCVVNVSWESESDGTYKPIISIDKTGNPDTGILLISKSSSDWIKVNFHQEPVNHFPQGNYYANNPITGHVQGNSYVVDFPISSSTVLNFHAIYDDGTTQCTVNKSPNQ